jgi:hypothetical protein
MCRKVNVSDVIDVLEICEIGLSRYQEAVAAGGIEHGAATRCLLYLGLLAPGPDGLVIPVPPATAAQMMLEPLRREVARHQHHMAALEPSFASAAGAYTAALQSSSGDVRVIRGADMISVALQTSVDVCTSELLTVQPGGRRAPDPLNRALASELPALRRGVAQRTIYQHAVRSHAPTMDYIREITQAGGEVRTLDEVVDRLIVCDKSVAFIPGGAPSADRVLEIRNPGIVRFIVTVFESMWQRAQPIEFTPGRRRPPEVVDEIQATIMRFLVEGYTDAKIARQLGLSLRTVATHIRKISDQLGSGSRAQLGYLIAVRNLLVDG